MAQLPVRRGVFLRVYPSRLICEDGERDRPFSTPAPGLPATQRRFGGSQRRVRYCLGSRQSPKTDDTRRGKTRRLEADHAGAPEVTRLCHYLWT